MFFFSFLRKVFFLPVVALAIIQNSVVSSQQSVETLRPRASGVTAPATSRRSLLSTDQCLPTTVVYFLPGAFFLATVARRGPLRVRALVWVRWPRTGSPRRWRRPR